MESFTYHSLQTSHKLQPLDVSVFGSFKGKLKTAFNDWHVAYAGKTITICQIAELSKLSFYESFTPKNIVHGFANPGICPFNKEMKILCLAKFTSRLKIVGIFPNLKKETLN
ncbi:hypothetical protein JTB14_013742 [Gonioctena quinquepunctata]|nr:hypothetical protein JTB14_013742 [Gonioctena quinquepunctata]